MAVKNNKQKQQCGIAGITNAIKSPLFLQFWVYIVAYLCWILAQATLGGGPDPDLWLSMPPERSSLGLASCGANGVLRSETSSSSNV